MTANEAVNEIKARARIKGISLTWWRTTDGGTTFMRLEAGRKYATWAFSPDEIFLDEHGKAIPGGDGSHLLKAYEKLEAELGVTAKIAGPDRARATMTGDGRVLCGCGAELECDHETGDMPEVCQLCGKTIDWSWFTFKEADE